MGRDEELMARLRAALAAAPAERPTWDPAVLDTAPPLRLRRRSQLAVAGVVAATLLAGSTGLAAAGALPDPAQHVAHQVLDTVGVQVPDPERYLGPECGPEVGRNHGAYVSEDHSLARSDCGKPVKAAGAGGSDKAAKADDGDPCTGPPPWAGAGSMTAEEKAAAQAERAAQCGADEAEEADEPDEPDEDKAVADEQKSPDAGSTTETTTTERQDGAPSSTTPDTTVAPTPPESPPTSVAPEGEDDDQGESDEDGAKHDGKPSKVEAAPGGRPG